MICAKTQKIRWKNYGSLQISSDLVRTSPHTLTAFSQKLNHAKKLKYNHLVADYDYNEYTTWVSQSYKTYKNFYRQIHFCKNISFKNYFLEFLDIDSSQNRSVSKGTKIKTCDQYRITWYVKCKFMIHLSFTRATKRGIDEQGNSYSKLKVIYIRRC